MRLTMLLAPQVRWCLEEFPTTNIHISISDLSLRQKTEAVIVQPNEESAHDIYMYTLM